MQIQGRESQASVQDSSVSAPDGFGNKSGAEYIFFVRRALLLPHALPP